ncbi:hypothetical protein ACWFR1_12760 [Streptomyces sp. NPDC055103]
MTVRPLALTAPLPVVDIDLAEPGAFRRPGGGPRVGPSGRALGLVRLQGRPSRARSESRQSRSIAVRFLVATTTLITGAASPAARYGSSPPKPSSMAAHTVVPLMVLNNLGAEQSAYFSLAWIVGYVLYLVSRNLGSSLVVEAVSHPERLVEHAVRMLRHTGLLLGAAIVLVAALAPQILSFFGPEHAEHGSTLLRLLALSALPNILVSLAIDVWRARRRLRWAVGVQVVMCVLVLGLTKLLLPTLGITGAGVAWLVTMCLLATPLLIWRKRWLTTGSGRSS